MGKKIENVEADVVPRPRVLGPRVPEANDEARAAGHSGFLLSLHGGCGA
jgi:hypothetical protein